MLEKEVSNMYIYIVQPVKALTIYFYAFEMR